MINIYDYLFKKVILITKDNIEWRGEINEISPADENYEEEGINEDRATLVAYSGSSMFFNSGTPKGQTFLIEFYVSEIKNIEIIE